MNLRFQTFSIPDGEIFKLKMLNWASRFNIFCFLDNQHYQLPHQQYDMILAAGAHSFISAPAGEALQQLSEFSRQRDGWLFGHLGYDLKNEIESLSSRHSDRLGFSDLFFFDPEFLFLVETGSRQVSIGVRQYDAGTLFAEINGVSPSIDTMGFPISLLQRQTREEYMSSIKQLQQHILRGDCYEINYCMELYAEGVKLSPLALYWRMSAASPNPFSAFYRVNDAWLVCASPERYLRRRGRQLLSQPIKGTSPRQLHDAQADAQQARQLQQSTKNRSENVMIVDLVRNDLSRVCLEGSVKVSELFGLQQFPQVYHLVSTIEGMLEPGLGLADIVRASFPMGSMTGAPKKRVMELIDQYETSRRGLFSGALGYCAPGGDFDFNVVIRSFLYQAATGYLSYPVGSGITFYSDPEQEYEECAWKASAIKKVLA